MDMGISMQIFTGVAVFWLGWMSLTIAVQMLKNLIFD